MDSAVYVPGITNMIAKSVEQCRCPERYTGLSCQDPAEGFYRWRNISETDTNHKIEDIIGKAISCQCNGRSHSCDRESGFCLVCCLNVLLHLIFFFNSFFCD